MEETTWQYLRRKIGSRKFITCLTALVTCICVIIGLSDNQTAQIVALIGAFGDMAIYMLSEASVDKANATSTSINIDSDTEDETDE